MEVVGRSELVTSCDFAIQEPIEVRTRGMRLWRARRAVADALFAQHHGWPTRGYRYCYPCGRDGNCERQELATEYGADPGVERSWPAPPPVTLLGEVLERGLGKCIGCERCARTCNELQGVGALNMIAATSPVANAAENWQSAPMLLPDLGDVVCLHCGQCMARCPTAALRLRDETHAVRVALADSARHVVIQVAPAPRVAIGEPFAQLPGTAMTWQLVTALRKAGFAAVFDTCFGADLTILEEGTELLLRLFRNRDGADPASPLPLLTSCCPAWVRHLEHAHPEYLPHLSTCKSPQQMFGALIKSWYAREKKLNPANIVSVALMPCVAKKSECRRIEMQTDGHQHVDYALTTRECAALLRELGIDLPRLDPGTFDEVFAGPSGSGVIFGYTGGVMEAALRTVLELVSGVPAERLFDEQTLEAVPGFDRCCRGEIRLPEQGAPVPKLLSTHFRDFAWMAGRTLRVGVVQGLHAIQEVMAALAVGAGPFADCDFIELMACPSGCLGGGSQPVPTDPDIRSAQARGLRAEDIDCGRDGLPRKSHENPAVLRLYREWLTDGAGAPQAHSLLHTHYTPQPSRSG